MAESSVIPPQPGVLREERVSSVSVTRHASQQVVTAFIFHIVPAVPQTLSRFV